MPVPGLPQATQLLPWFNRSGDRNSKGSAPSTDVLKAPTTVPRAGPGPIFEIHADRRAMAHKLETATYRGGARCQGSPPPASLNPVPTESRRGLRAKRGTRSEVLPSSESESSWLQPLACRAVPSHLEGKAFPCPPTHRRASQPASPGAPVDSHHRPKRARARPHMSVRAQEPVSEPQPLTLKRRQPRHSCHLIGGGMSKGGVTHASPPRMISALGQLSSAQSLQAPPP